MRSHPIAGSFFVLAGLALLGLGAMGPPAPGFLSKVPIPASVLMPFICWQLAVWCFLFGFFFLRPRGARRSKPLLARPTLRL